MCVALYLIAQIVTLIRRKNSNNTKGISILFYFQLIILDREIVEQDQKQYSLSKQHQVIAIFKTNHRWVSYKLLMIVDLFIVFKYHNSYS